MGSPSLGGVPDVTQQTQQILTSANKNVQNLLSKENSPVVTKEFLTNFTNNMQAQTTVLEHSFSPKVNVDEMIKQKLLMTLNVLEQHKTTQSKMTKIAGPLFWQTVNRFKKAVKRIHQTKKKVTKSEKTEMGGKK